MATTSRRTLGRGVRSGWRGRLLALLTTTLALAASAAAPPIVRGIYGHPGEAIDDRVWSGYGTGYTLDRQQAHGGTLSMRCSNSTDHGA